MKSFLQKVFISILMIGAVCIPVSASAAGLIVCGEDYNNDGVLRNYVDTSGKEVPEVCGFNDLIRLVNVAIDFLIFAIMIPGATILFMYAGFLYITTSIVDNKKKAKGIFMKVLWGLVWSLCAWLLVKFIVLGLGGSEETLLWLLD